jgi:hypothetical protein
MEARMEQRIYQLDFVAAFLQAEVIGRKFTILPADRKHLLANNVDIHKWLGVPLLLKKFCMETEPPILPGIKRRAHA